MQQLRMNGLGSMVDVIMVDAMVEEQLSRSNDW